MALTQECTNVYFLQQICSDVENNVFKTPWGSILIHNCDDTGKLLEFNTVSDYHDSKKNLWLNLTLMLFRPEGQDIFPVWCCPECPSMRDFTSMGVENDPSDFLPLLCLHSKAASFLNIDWATLWNVDLDADVTSNKVTCNEDITVVTCKEYRKCELFLAAVRAESKVHILHTVTRRQSAPLCTTFPAPFCTTAKCKHFREYTDTINKEGFASLLNPAFQENEVHEEDGPPGANSRNEPDVDEGNEGDEGDEEDHDNTSIRDDKHYLTGLSRKEFSKMCGYNFTKIPYPFKRCRLMQSVWQRRMQNIYDFPSKFIPEYSEHLKCSHGELFDPNDDNLTKESENISIINEIGEQTFSTQVMCRRTLGNCRCVQQYDGHPQLLWGGVRYIYLLYFLSSSCIAFHPHITTRRCMQQQQNNKPKG